MASNGNSGGGLEELLKFLAMMQTVSGLAGGAESTISTQESVRERARVARETAGNLLLAAMGILTGLVLHTWGWLYRVGASRQDGALLSLTGVGLLLYLVFVGVLAVAMKQRWGVGLLSGYLLALAGTWTLGFGLLVFVAPVQNELGLPMAAVGLAGGLVSMPFFYNQWRDLVDPYWRQSPYERAIQTNLFPAISKLALSGDSEEPEPVREVLEVRQEGNGEYILDSEALGLTPEALLRFGHELMKANGDLAESRWGGFRGVFASYPEYRTVRARMQEYGLCRPVNPSQSNSPFELTPRGRAGFRRLAEAYQERAHAHTRTQA